MKVTYLAFIILLTSCSQICERNDSNSSNDDRQMLLGIQYQSNKMYLNDTVIQQINSLIYDDCIVNLVTTYCDDSTWFGQRYSSIVYKQFFEFYSRDSVLKKSFKVKSNSISFETPTNDDVIGSDNFIYKIFPMQIDSGFVFVAYGLSVNQMHEVIEYSSVYSSNGMTIFDGYVSKGDYDSLTLFWQKHGVAHKELQEANSKSIVYTFER